MRRWILLIALIAVTACTSSDDMSLLHREITDVQRQVQRLDQKISGQDLKALEAQTAEQAANVMRSNADIATRMDELNEEIEALRASLELTTRRLATISQQLAESRQRTYSPVQIPPVSVREGDGEAAEVEDPDATPAEGARPAPSAGPTQMSPDELYRNAYEDYLRGNYDLAIQGFAEYVDRYGATDLADNALYWIGECHTALEQPEEALKAFSKVLENYPNSDKAAAAQLKKGMTYLTLNDQGQGVIHLQYVVYEHPGTKEADLARDKLRSLGITIR